MGQCLNNLQGNFQIKTKIISFMTKFNSTYQSKKTTVIASVVSKISRTFLLAVVAVSLGGSIVYYLSQINYISEKGFAMRDMEKKISDLRDENEKLQLRMVELRSMSDLSARMGELSLVPVGNMTYFDTTGQVVAKR